MYYSSLFLRKQDQKQWSWFVFSFLALLFPNDGDMHPTNVPSYSPSVTHTGIPAIWVLNMIRHGGRSL